MKTIITNLSMFEVLAIAAGAVATISAMRADNNSRNNAFSVEDGDGFFENKSVLIATTAVPTVLNFITGAADSGEFNKTQAEVSYKNATGVLDWIKVACYGYAAYAFSKSGKEGQIGMISAAAAAVLNLVSMLSTDPASSAQPSVASGE